MTEEEETQARSVAKLVTAIKMIADSEGVCPICLTYAVAEYISVAEDRGVIRHLAEEGDDDASTHGFFGGSVH